jgi:hypothetical protein
MRPRLLPVVLTLVACLTTATGADAKPVLTLQDDAVFVDGRAPFGPDVAFGHLETLGVQGLRMSIPWAEAARPGGRYDFGRWQDAVDAAGRRGIGVRISLTGPAPARYTADRRVGFRRPDAAAFGRFAGAAARALRDVRSFSIWNEPNWKRLLVPAAEAPLRYRAMYLAGFEQIKRARPNAAVLLGELSPGNRPAYAMPPLQFLREMACVDRRYRPLPGRRCGTLKADGVALHPYNFEAAPSRRIAAPDAVEIGTLDRAVGALRKLRRAGALRSPRAATMPLYLTEFGLFTAGERRRFSLSRTAAYLRQSYALAARIPSVKEFLQYKLVNPVEESEDTFRTGLLDPDGRPYPSYAALRDAVR